MYKSPIELMYGDMQLQMEGDILKAVQSVGVHVDREELIKALKHDRDQYQRGYEDAKAAQRWIPCSERLPRENEFPEHRNRVLVFCEDGMVRTYTIKHLLEYKQTTSPDYPYWHIAWMPLPEAYKEGENK